MDSGWVPVLSPGVPTIYTSTLTVIMQDQEQFSIQCLAQHFAILIAKVCTSSLHKTTVVPPEPTKP